MSTAIGTVRGGDPHDPWSGRLFDGTMESRATALGHGGTRLAHHHPPLSQNREHRSRKRARVDVLRSGMIWHFIAGWPAGSAASPSPGSTMFRSAASVGATRMARASIASGRKSCRPSTTVTSPRRRRNDLAEGSATAPGTGRLSLCRASATEWTWFARTTGPVRAPGNLDLGPELVHPYLRPYLSPRVGLAARGGPIDGCRRGRDGRPSKGRVDRRGTHDFVFTRRRRTSDEVIGAEGPRPIDRALETRDGRATWAGSGLVHLRPVSSGTVTDQPILTCSGREFRT